MLQSLIFNFANFFAGFPASYKDRFYIHSFDKSFLNPELTANNQKHSSHREIHNSKFLERF